MNRFLKQSSIAKGLYQFKSKLLQIFLQKHNTVIYTNSQYLPEIVLKAEKIINFLQCYIPGDYQWKANLLDYLALLYDYQKRYKKAELLIIQALEMKKRLLGEKHSHVATLMHRLGLFYCSQKNMNKRNLC